MISRTRTRRTNPEYQKSMTRQTCLMMSTTTLTTRRKPPSSRRDGAVRRRGGRASLPRRRSRSGGSRGLSLQPVGPSCKRSAPTSRTSGRGRAAIVSGVQYVSWCVMGKATDLTMQRFGRLVVLRFVELIVMGTARHRIWEVRCDRRTFNHLLTVDGKTATLAEWSEMTGLKHTTIRERLRRGWDASRAVTAAVTSSIARAPAYSSPASSRSS